MEAVGNAIYSAMQNDTTLLALLGAPTVSPYNVFHAEVPQGFDFSPSTGAHKCITYSEVSSVVDQNFVGISCQGAQELYNITSMARLKTDAEAIDRRVKWLLHDKRGVTQPSSGAVILNIKRESKGGVQWDSAWKCYYTTSIYRVWAKEEDFH
jgi:hypothetical protein